MHVDRILLLEINSDPLFKSFVKRVPYKPIGSILCYLFFDRLKDGANIIPERTIEFDKIRKVLQKCVKFILDDHFLPSEIDHHSGHGIHLR